MTACIGSDARLALETRLGGWTESLGRQELPVALVVETADGTPRGTVEAGAGDLEFQASPGSGVALIKPPWQAGMTRAMVQAAAILGD